VNGQPHDVLGEGGKDGTYYVLDRDGVNAVTGVRWDDSDPSALPYWRTNVVPGGSQGGIIATAAVDEAARRVYFSTAPGLDVLNPQRPTVHALDADTGAIVWENTAEPNADASFAPTSAIPGVVFVGKDLGAVLRAYDAGTGTELASVGLPGGFTLTSAPAVVDGTVILGAGSGERSSDPTDTANVAAHTPQNITALCVTGTADCDPGPRDRCDEGGSAPGDARALAAVQASAEVTCPCAAFDGGSGHTHADYVQCVRGVVATAIHTGALRARCRGRGVRDAETSTCGRAGAVVCCESAAVARCLVVPAGACVSSAQRVRTRCAPATRCAATTCLSAGVCAAGR
jgi:hypothetical protein